MDCFRSGESNLAAPCCANHNRKSKFVYRESKLDPFSQVIILLKPQAVFWRIVEAHDSWTIGFNATNHVVLGQILEGVCTVEREDGVRFDLQAGDFMLMVAPGKWTMSALGGGIPVEFGAAVQDPSLLFSPSQPETVSRFIAVSFTVAAANHNLIETLRLPIVQVHRSEAPADRLGALLATLGDEVLSDRPGRSIVVDHFLEVILVEALRYRSPDIAEGNRGLLAGLTDPQIGRALRIMHADTRQPWTLVSLAREVGMSRAALASRFVQVVGVPPIEYLSKWRLSLAKSALASSEVPLTDIAEMAGYQSVSAFSTAFRRETGLSPTLYMQSLRATV